MHGKAPHHPDYEHHDPAQRRQRQRYDQKQPHPGEAANMGHIAANLRSRIPAYLTANHRRIAANCHGLAEPQLACDSGDLARNLSLDLQRKCCPHRGRIA